MRVAVTMLLAACTVVNPDELQHTACESALDCARAGEQCCDGYCRSLCTPDPERTDAGVDAGEPVDGGSDAGTCAGLPNGSTCQNPSYSPCRYANPCATSGDRDRVDAVCGAGQCLTLAPVLLQNDPACARATDTVACGTGQRCSSAQCRCDVVACGAAFGTNRGCCEGDTCRPGTSTAACGASGAACSVCTGLECCGPSTSNPAGPTACRTLCL